MSNTVDYMMCLIVYNFQMCSKKKKMGSTSPSKYIFLISPPSQIPRSKIEKIEKVCEQTSFISDMKLYTISLQNPNKKKLTCKPWCFLTEFYRDFIARILSCH